MKVQDVMQSSVTTCAAQESLDSIAHKLWEHDCGALPVVDPDGRPIAMITDRDVCMAAYTSGKPLHQLSAALAMSKQLVTCRPQEDLASVAHRMAKHGIRRIPAVDAGGVLVGILSLNDFVQDGTEAPSAGEAMRVLAAVSQHRSKVPAAPPPSPARPVGRSQQSAG